MGKLAKSSELVAMKAAGVGIRQLTLPLLLLGVLVSIGTLYGGEWIIPKSNFLRKEVADGFGEPVTRRSEIGKPTIRQASQGIQTEFLLFRQ